MFLLLTNRLWRVTLALGCLIGAFVAAAPAHAAQLVAVAPATDNYKARYNADPSVPELRTWLSWKGVAVAGTRCRPAAGSEQFTGSVSVVCSGLGNGTLSIASASGPARLVGFRVDLARGFWGPFLQLRSRRALRSTAVRMTLRLHVRGTLVGSRQLSYRYAPALASAGPSSLEYNGPGGRWWVGSSRTPTNVEIGRP